MKLRGARVLSKLRFQSIEVTVRNKKPLYVLDNRLAFPDPREAREDGLLALGGDFSVQRLLLAYASGIYPWSADPITWWSPDPRSVIPLDHFHVPRRLAQKMRQGRYEITLNKAFHQVIEGCSNPTPGRGETWISREFIRAYGELHELGHAHSVECWMDGELAGGVYGVALGGLFAGESMFHVRSDASNFALIHLLEIARDLGFTLFDVQVANDHTRRFGATDIPRPEYLSRLNEAIAHSVIFASEASGS